MEESAIIKLHKLVRPELYNMLLAQVVFLFTGYRLGRPHLFTNRN